MGKSIITLIAIWLIFVILSSITLLEWIIIGAAICGVAYIKHNINNEKKGKN